MVSLPDILRYHIFLQFLSFSDLCRLFRIGALIATLFQTNTYTLDINNVINLTLSSNSSFIVHSPAPFPPSNASIPSLINTITYNLSIFTVNPLLISSNFYLAASENHLPVGLNITKALIDEKKFNVVTSMLMVLEVVDEFKVDERGVKIIIFMSTDLAFMELSATERPQSLPPEKKVVVLKFHILHSY